MLTCLFIMGQVFSSIVSPFSKLNMSRPIVEKCMQFLCIFIYSQLLQLSKLPLHMFIFQTNLFRDTWPLLNGQLNFWWDKH